MRTAIIALMMTIASQAGAEVIMHCGASKGYSYLFNDPLWNSHPSAWHEDKISNGRIILLKEGADWDILFGDAIGSKGYRSDGAKVIALHWDERFIRVGAFHTNFTDIYNFNLVERTVVWSSNKSGPLMGKVAVYFSDCN